MGGLFTMLLFLVFILSALFTVLTGSRVYENITARSDKNFSSSTALSYIANKVRQGDRAGMTDIKEIEGLSFSREGNVLHIRTEGENGGTLSLSLRSGSLAENPVFGESESGGIEG